MRRTAVRRRMADEQIVSFLEGHHEGVLSTNGSDGYPYGVPVNYVYIDGRIFIHGGLKGEKIGNIVEDSHCCFTVMDSKGFEVTGDYACNVTTVYESVIVRGDATVIDDVEEKEKILRTLVTSVVSEKKDDPMPLQKVDSTAVIRIDPVSVTGKTHQMMS